MFTSWVFWLWIIIALLVGAVVGFLSHTTSIKENIYKKTHLL